jgi:hypothetical protein
MVAVSVINRKQGANGEGQLITYSMGIVNDAYEDITKPTRLVRPRLYYFSTQEAR